MTLFRPRALASALAFLMFVAAPALAASADGTPHWNVTYPVKGGRATQAVSLTSTLLIINSRFPQNTARVTVPLNTIGKITAPYTENGAWAIDLRLTAKAKLHSELNIGMVENLETEVTALSFLSEADAAAARTFLLSKIPHH